MNKQYDDSGGKSSNLTPGASGVDFEKIPPELKSFPNWVLWNRESKDGRLTKVPYQCDGRPAKNNDPATWADFESVVASYNLGGCSGIGFVFQESCGIIGIDLDHVVDRETGKIIAPWAEKVVQDLNSYTEYSPSGDGLHVLCKGSIPANGKDGVDSNQAHIEMYHDRLYFTVTGGVFQQFDTIRDCTTDLAAAYDFMRTRKASMNPPKDPPPKQEPPPKQDGEFQWDSDIQHLPVKESTKRLILDGAPKGQRSEAMMTVFNACVWSGLDDDQIIGVFLAYAIGQKFRDDHHSNIEWLQPQIDKARIQTIDRATASGAHDYCGPDPAPEDEPDQVKQESSFISLVDIAAMEFEHDPVIDGLLDKKESLLLVAESGIGKSMILNQILFNLAMPPLSGLWTKFPIKRPATSLFMQSENTMKAESFRLKRLFRAHPEFKRAGNRVVAFKVNNDIRISGSLMDKEFQKKIVSACLTVGADVLVIDPLISFHESDENSNTEMRTSLDALTAIQDKANVSCFLTHHTGKNGDSRGASAIKDWVANQLKFSREVTADPEKYVLRVQHEKARNFPQKPDFFLERTNDFDFILVDQPGSKEDSQVRAVVDSLVTLGGSVESQSKLIEAVMALMNCGRTHAQKAIDYALTQDKIQVIPGKSNNKTGYRLHYES